jgi:hypothetical protein
MKIEVIARDRMQRTNMSVVLTGSFGQRNSASPVMELCSGHLFCFCYEKMPELLLNVGLRTVGDALQQQIIGISWCLIGIARGLCLVDEACCIKD